MRSRFAIVLVVGAFALGAFIVATVVGGGGHDHGAIAGESTLEHATQTSQLSRAARISVDPLKSGEQWVSLTMPGGSYTPQGTNGGTDDYRCILFDPHFTQDTFISSVALQPGIAGEVHHAILYRVDPDEVGSAEDMDATDPRLGWSCFGGPGVKSKGGDDQLGGLAAAPWVAAFATTGGEQHFAPGTGELMKAGSELILQIHYNMLSGTLPDDSSVLLRAEPAGTDLKPLETYLTPAPVEVPCAPSQTGPLCDRTAALADVMKRFGYDAGTTVAGLQLLCGGQDLANPPASDTSTCTRYIDKPMVLQSAAGHMHMLGTSISMQLIRSDGSTVPLFKRAVWNFDDQHADVLPQPVKVGPGDKIKITCTWDPTLRDKLPALQGLPERYIVWGDGSADEMCLGIFTYTKS